MQGCSTGLNLALPVAQALHNPGVSHGCHAQHAAPALDVRTAGRPGSSSSSSGAGASSATGSAGGGHPASSLLPSAMLGPGATALSGLSSRLESSLAALGFRAGGSRESVEDPLEPFLSEPQQEPLSTLPEAVP